MSDKLDDTIAAIPAFVPGQVGQDLVVQARAWARSKGEAAKTSLELGGHLHGKNEKQRRQAVRVYLLAYQALGLDHEIGALTRARESVVGTSMGDLQNKIRTDIAPYVMILQDANRLRFGWSFRAPGTAEKQNQLLRAWTRVPATVRQALSALDNVRTGGRRARGVPTGPFQDYFGGTAYLDIVKNKLGLVATMADTAILWLYYRGQNCHDPNHSDWPFASIDKGIKPLAAVGASNRPKNREGGSAMFPLAQHRNGLQESGDIHVLVGVDAEHGSNKDMQHMIIHEITHYAADTRDVKYLPGLGEAVVVNRPNGQQVNVVNPAKDPMNPGVKAARLDIKKNAVRTYGDDLCRSMAQRHPEKAAHNADSYAYYCMHFADGW